jgi:hypothetical protein
MALGSFVLSLIATAATFQVGSLLSSLLVTSSGSVINRPNVFPQAVHARNITPIGPQQLRWDGPVWRDKPDQTLWVNDIDVCAPPDNPTSPGPVADSLPS